MTRYIAHPLCLFLMVWSAAAILYAGGVLTGTFSPPLPLTLGVLLLHLGTFSLGYLTWSLWQDLAPTTTVPWIPVRPGTRERIARALKVTLCVGIVALGIELYRIAVVAAHFNTDLVYLVTHPAVFRLRIVMFIGTDVFKTSHLVMLLSLTNAAFSIGFILLGLFLHLDRTRWKYVYLFAFLLISLAIGMTHLSRYEVTANILYLVFTYCCVQSLERSQDPASGFQSSGLPLRTSNFKLLIPMAAIAALFLAIDLLLRKSAEFGQTNRLEGLLFHFFWYIASPLAALNEFLTTFAGDYTLGQNMFFPFYKWLCRLHLAQEAEVTVYGEKVFIPFVANTYTYLRSFYEDFGLLGVALAPYALGWITAAVRQRARQYFHYLNLYIVLLTLILFSFYNYFLSSNQIYLQILFGFAFFRYDLMKAHESHSRR